MQVKKEITSGPETPLILLLCTSKLSWIATVLTPNSNFAVKFFGLLVCLNIFDFSDV